MKRQRTTDGQGRRRRRLSLAVTGLLIVAACSNNGDSGGDEGAGPAAPGDGPGSSEYPDNFLVHGVEEEGEPTSGGTVTVGLESETNSFHPAEFQGSQAGFNVAYAIYDPLANRNNEGEVEPYLAESIEPNDDFTEWTLTLRDGVTFHDGTDLDAEALKTIFDEYLTADGATTAGALRDVDEMEIVDDLTVRYILNQPHAAFPDILATPPGWVFSPTAAAEAGDDFGSAPVGTGPFEFVSWQRDGELVVERNDNYWQEGQPYLDGITFRPIPDEETRASSLETRDIDAAQSVRLSSFLARVEGISGVEIALGLSNGAGNAMFNTAEPPVDDVRVRRALAHATDQQAAVDVVAGEAAPYAEVRTQLFASNSPYYSEAAAEAWPEYDPEQAEALLEEYMNDPDRSDGRDVGDPVEVRFDATNVPSLVEQGRAYEDMWENVGFEVEVRPVEQSVHIGEAFTGDYQIKSYRVGTDADPLVTIQNTFGDPEAYPTNLTNFNNDTIEDVIETLRTTDDLDERIAAVDEFSVLMAEEVPIIWTGTDLAFIAYDESLSGVAGWTFPSGSLGDGATPAIIFWGQVWIDE
jgi:peptide/nickel transport system substrate-binding protein